MEQQTAKFKKEGKLLEAERLRRRTNFDLECLKETGYCHGVENLFPPFGIPPGGRRALHFIGLFFLFAKQFSNRNRRIAHDRPQIGGMYEGDRSRKQTLIDFGFRLPARWITGRWNLMNLKKSEPGGLRIGHAGEIRIAESTGS